MSLRSGLEARRSAGGKCLVPYLTGGLGEWTRMIEAVAQAGADGIEVGIPFSDPVMDGPVIQRASSVALEQGATPVSVLDGVAGVDVDVPLAVMTYVNLVYRFGWERFAAGLVSSGVSGAILPDLPLEEADEWTDAADTSGVETVMLAAPTASEERLGRIAARSRGFVYAVGLLGVTGERDALADSASVIAARVKELTELPVLVGVGISTPEQAVQVCEVADGVVVGSAVVRRALETGSPESVAELVGTFREALERG